MAKYKNRMYKAGSFCAGSNMKFNLIMCEDEIFIPSILQSYVLNWRHTYLLHTEINITESIICQHLYWHGIRTAVSKGVKIVTLANIQNRQI